jgi:hypothetical protein
MSEADELELAMELLAVSNDMEWEQFLGNFFKKIGRGLKKAGSFVFRKVLRPLGGALKGLAKKALPFVGTALGSFIPIPGVGSAIGGALGSAVAKALEMEFGEMEQEEAELEIARRIVRIAASAARQAADDESGADPEVVVRDALLAAARAHVPNFAAQETELYGEQESGFETGFETGMETGFETEFEGESGGAMSGRWLRHGRHIVVHGA